ncbi:MAG: MFS transporter [Actinobacteria bacterium]|nr:MFS transporter [Actinomycetota bacterium]
MLRVRWMGQLTDGAFQSALASFVLFSPERQPDAVKAALAFTVVLLPYSLVGPYAGIFLDRFSRKRVIQFANFLRAADLLIIAILIFKGSTGLTLTLFVLFAFGINRLILAGLSAGLPLLVEKKELIAANALAVTGGTIFVVIGGGLGIGLKNILDTSKTGDHIDALLILISAAGYLTAALFASRIGKREIGPLPHEISQEIKGFGEMLQGFHILRSHGDALRGIFATGVQRGGITALTLMALLLERNTFNATDNPDAGLRGFAYALAIAGVGIGLGALAGPFGVAKFGRHKWIRISMLAPIGFLLLFGIFPNEFMMITTAFFVGGFGQSLKITNDALVQSKIEDEFRGRIFAFYDVAVNGAIVSGAIISALVLPADGVSLFMPWLIALAYALAAFVLLRKTKFAAYSSSTS